MLVRIVGIISFCLYSQIIFSQDLLQSRKSSYQTNIYKLSEKEAEHIYSQRKWLIDTSFFHTLIDSYPTDSIYNKTLLSGHYLKVYILKDELKIDINSVQSFHAEVLNNSSDLQLKVFSHQGEILDKAKVKLASRTIKFDEKTQSYLLRKSNRKGLVKIYYNGESAYYNLRRNYKNSIIKRNARKVVHGTPLKYVWRPVDFVINIPVDGVMSIVNGYPVGSIRKTGSFFSKLYRSVACLFDDFHCNDYDSYRFENKYKGYFAFNKPKYLPGDTVKFKAFITNRKGKPIQRSVDVVLVKSYNKHIVLTQLAPYEKGGFTYEFPLSDTLDLQLDRSYRIELRKKKGKKYLSEYFEHEEYELAKNKMKLEVARGKLYVNDTVSLTVSATDENDLNLLDARLEVLVSPKGVTSYFDHRVFVPDTIAYFEMALEPTGKTSVEFPSNIFPPVNFNFEVIISLLSSDNERLSEQAELSYFFSKEEITYELGDDSLKFDYLVDGKPTSALATIFGKDAFGNKVDSVAEELPFSLVINPYYASYEIEVLDRKKSFLISEETSLLNFQSNRTLDSLFINSNNPRGISFNYFLYKSNREIERGFTKHLTIARRSVDKQAYHLAIQYLWGGRVFEQNYVLPDSRDVLSVKLDAPPVIYPGQKVEVEVSVKDQEGNPVKNTDVLVHGLTKKFNANPIELPKLGKLTKDRQLINTFHLSQDPFFQKKRSYDYHRWNPLMVLDSISYFQFLYPGNKIFRYEFDTHDGTTQFSPFVIMNGSIQAVSVIYIDKLPVYFSWSDDVPYSFPIDSSFHTISIRTRSHQFDLDSVLFNQGKKLILSFDQNVLPNQVKMREKTSPFSNREKDNLARYMLPYRNTFAGRFGYFQHGTSYYPVFTPSQKSTVGPITNSRVKFNLFDGFKHSFIHERNYEYELSEGLVKMREIDLSKGIKSPYVAVEHFDDLAWTKEKIKLRWQNELMSRRRNARKYSNPATTSSGNGNLLLELHDRYRDKNTFSNTLLLKLDDSEFFRVYPAFNTNFQDLEEGYYQTLILFGDGRYSLLDSLKIVANGLNYALIDTLTISQRDTFSIQINHQMDQYFTKLASYPLGKSARRALYRTYQRRFQYFGEGRIVSGIITDDTGETLPGVNVIIKGTTYGTTTDLDGFYSLKVPSYASELIYSFVGFETEEMEIGSRNKIDLSMGGATELQEVVVTAYSIVKTSQSLGYSVSTVDGKLAGVVAGVEIAGASGTLQIRGLASLSGNNSPLLVIDGVPFLGELSSLSEETFANVELLKSESAVALYGERAANGVLLITTKNGIPGITPFLGEKAELNSSLLQRSTEGGSIRKNFSDVAIWRPGLRTDDSGKARFSVTFPDDITKWETFVYAVNGRKQVGQTRTEIKSFKPIAAQLSVPRFLVEGDSSIVIGKSLNYTFDSVSVETSFVLNDKEEMNHEIRISNSHIDTLRVTPSLSDSLKIRYFLKREDGYFDGEERTIPVFPKGIEKKEGFYATLHDDTTVNWTFSPADGPVYIFADSDPIDILKQKIEYLATYPYTCNEQLASKLKALIISKRLEKRLDLKIPNDPEIRRLINRLKNNRNKEGMWGWWNVGPTSTWISIHVFEALTLARQDGYKVSLNEKELAEEAVWNLVSARPVSEKIDWLYISSLLNLQVDYVKFINEFDRSPDLGMEERLRILRVRQFANQKVSVDWVVDSLRTNSFGAAWLTDEKNELEYARANLKLSGMALDVLLTDSIQHTENSVRNLRNYLLSELAAQSHLNTYTSSNMIAILSEFLRDLTLAEKPQISISGGFSETAEDFPYYKVIENASNLTISKTGAFPIYLTAYQRNWMSDPSRDSSNFIITSQFEYSDSILAAGKPVELKASVQVDHEVKYVMIEIPIPAGCSYNSKRRYFRGEVHREYHKDKVSIFCEQLRAGVHEFKIDLLPRYSGRYFLNPAKIELMYFPTFNAHEGLKKVTVQP